MSFPVPQQMRVPLFILLNKKTIVVVAVNMGWSCALSLTGVDTVIIVIECIHFLTTNFLAAVLFTQPRPESQLS